VAELFAVLITGALHLVFENVFDAKAVFLVLAAAFWTCWIALRVRRRPALLREWGLGLDIPARAWRDATAFGLLALAVLATIGAARGSLRLTPHMLPLLAFYPVWGLLQQFLVQALVARNLQSRFAMLAAPARTTIATALLFGAAHLPDLALAPLTVGLLLGFTPLYLRDRRLLPLGLIHGWLGVAAYYWVLDRDPWLELRAQIGF